MDSPPEITQLLLALEQGDPSAAERLLPLVEKELRRLARSYMRKVENVPLLQTTMLIDDAYLKLVNQNRVHWKNRNHFFAIAATCMRRILLDYVRTEHRKKRGGGVEHIALSDATLISNEKSVELLALDEALSKLEMQDVRQSQIVEMRFFGGYSMKEVAEILEISESTANKEWDMAQAWLHLELNAARQSSTQTPPINSPVYHKHGNT
jgi:RNA polymerase sigma factor (TIGR02999 family)